MSEKETIQLISHKLQIIINIHKEYDRIKNDDSKDKKNNDVIEELAGLIYIMDNTKEELINIIKKL